jgi:folate-binding protein YgfZ
LATIDRHGSRSAEGQHHTMTDIATRLGERGFVRVRGPDAAKLLDNTISNSLGKLIAPGDVIHGGLLTPQGKILFAFFVVKLEDGFLLDTDAASTAGLIQRLSMYKLRADAEISDVSGEWIARVAASEAAFDGASGRVTCRPDPRSADVGVRAYFETRGDEGLSTEGLSAYDDRRVIAGIADAVVDFALGETFTHEANWDETGSVDFTKGCFIGQEVVSRTRHKTVVRKRICKVTSTGQIPNTAAILAGEREIGTILTRAGDLKSALAMIRIDHAVSAAEHGIALTAGTTQIELDPSRIATYRDAMAKQADKAGAS